MRPVVIALLAALLVAACGSAGPTDQPASGTPSAASHEPADTGGSEATPPAGERTPGTALSACELVTPADIEVALALSPGTVSPGALTAAGTILDPAATECRYRDDAWGGLVVNVTPTDGANVYDALDKAYGDKAERLDVGDGAFWFEDNDRGYFLRGSVMVLLQFTFLASGSPFRDPTVAVGGAAVAKL